MCKYVNVHIYTYTYAHMQIHRDACTFLCLIHKDKKKSYICVTPYCLWLHIHIRQHLHLPSLISVCTQKKIIFPVISVVGKNVNTSLKYKTEYFPVSK